MRVPLVNRADLETWEISDMLDSTAFPATLGQSETAVQQGHQENLDRHRPAPEESLVTRATMDAREIRESPDTRYYRRESQEHAGPREPPEMPAHRVRRDSKASLEDLVGKGVQDAQATRVRQAHQDGQDP